MDANHLPPEIWNLVYHFLDPTSLRKGASLVCKDWLFNIRNDPHLSSEFFSTSYLAYKDVNSIFVSFPILHTIQFQTTSYKHKNFQKIDLDSATKLKEVILEVEADSDENEDIFYPSPEKPKRTKMEEEYEILEPIKDMLNVKQIMFNPKEELSLSLKNIWAVELSLHKPYIVLPYNFNLRSLGTCLKNLKTLHLNLYGPITDEEQFTTLFEMLKSLRCLKHLEVDFMEGSHESFADMSAIPLIIQSSQMSVSLAVSIVKMGILRQICQSKINSILECFRLSSKTNLKKVRFKDCLFKPGIEMQHHYYTVKELILEDCQFYTEHLKSFVKIFPNLESLKLTNCKLPILLPPGFARYNDPRYFPLENLLCHLNIISGLKNLKRLQLLLSYCVLKTEKNENCRVNMISATVAENAIKCLEENFSLDTTKIQMMVCERNVLCDKNSVIAEITKVYGEPPKVTHFEVL